MTDNKTTKEQVKTEELKTADSAGEQGKFKGKYISTIGRRKTAVARVRVYRKGSGIIIVNGLNINDYFDATAAMIAKQALKSSGNIRDLNVSVVAKGGGKGSQAEAVRHGISRALVEIDKNLRPSLKARGWMTRDARKKERKKPGLKKARRAPQWSKR